MINRLFDAPLVGHWLLVFLVRNGVITVRRGGKRRRGFIVAPQMGHRMLSDYFDSIGGKS